MLPKNSKHYIVPAAEDLEQSPDLVEDVVSFYYATLRKSLSDLKFPLIQVENLGLFRIKVGELPKLISKYQQHLDVLQPETFNQMAIKKRVEGNLRKVIAVQQIVKSESKRKSIHLDKKNGTTRGHMDSTKTDPGGCEEHSC